MEGVRNPKSYKIKGLNILVAGKLTGQESLRRKMCLCTNIGKTEAY